MEINNHRFSWQDIDDLNLIADYLAVRDIDRIGKRKRIDLVILLGNADIGSIDITINSFREVNAENLLISGGVGHSTHYLYENIRDCDVFGYLKDKALSEAELFYQMILKTGKIDKRYIAVESKSTNCGSNAREALMTVKERGLKPESVLLIQDATMQRRTLASFEKEWTEENVKFFNYSVQRPALVFENDTIIFDKDSYPWDLQRFIHLLLGEIPRLMDDENGYGPNGKGFIVHVDIPDEVMMAYQRLQECLPPSFLNR